MIEIADLLDPDRVILNLKSGSKRHIMRALAERAAKAAGIDREIIYNALMEREKLGTTGVGDGIAIPHAKLVDLDHIVGIFARLDTPVDFDALDDRPIDLVFLLLAPDDCGAIHLKALARVARILRDDGLCKRLRLASDGDAVFRMLTEKPEVHAA